MKILKYGSNKNRMKLSHIPALDLSATRIQEPIIHGKDYKSRSSKYIPSSERKKQKRNKAAGKEDDEEEVKRLELGKLDDQALKKKSMRLD